MSDEVLRYTPGKRSQGTVRREYTRWRAAQNPPLPDRCDNEKCRFYAEPLIWNGEPFKPNLDHRNGVNSDNRAENLRYLCPICNSQLKTHGGGNKGRVKKAPGSYAIRDDSDLWHHQMPVEPGRLELQGSEVTFEIIQASSEPKKG